MPRAPRICGQLGCPEPAVNQGRCLDHQRVPWVGSDRKAHLPRSWPVLRKRVLRRDHYRCQIHGPGCTLVATEVDHMGGRDDHRPEVLQAVCTTCHGHKTAAEGLAARNLGR